MYCVFDTETSNLPVPNYPLEHPSQCRVIQVAALLLDSDFKEQAHFKVLCSYQDQFEIAPGAMAAHHIDKELLDKFAVPAQVVVMMLDSMITKSDFQVCHNVAFDKERIENMELLLFGRKQIPFTKQFCTMQISTPLCKLPSRIPTKFKWPKLAEAYKHFFNEELSGAHDALNDVRATAKIFKYLIMEGFIPELKTSQA